MKHIVLKFIKVYFFIPLVLLSVFVAGHTDPAELDKNRKKDVQLKEIHCMAENIFYEARNEPHAGQAAVARVVVNRVKYGFANTPCKVIYQVIERDNGSKICQFSWVCEGKSKPNKHDPSYLKALQISYQVLVFDAYKDVVPKSTLFFHNLSVSPNWPYHKAKQIGNHIFYTKAKVR
jgi:spore germination cell wall hydrolase CwlJ-like protein